MNGLISDDVLVKRILKGSEIAFSQLYERYHKSVYSSAYRILKDHEEAQDAVQEVFIKLYLSLHKWDARKSKLSTWISCLAKNHSIDCSRMRCRRAETQIPENNPERLLGLYSRQSSSLSPFVAYRNKEEIETVRYCIGSLPEQQKKAFIRRYFQECKLVEIAEMEQCKLATVKTSLYRATHSVRNVLTKSKDFRFSTMTSSAQAM